MKSIRSKFWAVAIGIMVILGALAVPQYAKVRPESVLRAHVNSLRHIAQGLIYYAQEHEGNFPLTLDVLAEYDPSVKRTKSYAHGDVYYLRPQRRLSECASKDIILLSTSRYGTAIAYVDGSGSAIQADWTNQK